MTRRQSFQQFIAAFAATPMLHGLTLAKAVPTLPTASKNEAPCNPIYEIRSIEMAYTAVVIIAVKNGNQYYVKSRYGDETPYPFTTRPDSMWGYFWNDDHTHFNVKRIPMRTAR